MKYIKYNLKVVSKDGSYSSGPLCYLPYSESNMELVKSEAFGDVTIEYGNVPQEEVIADMSEACNQAIVSGVDVTLSDGGTYHFSLGIEDQINMMNLQSMVLSGAESVPYHADGEGCRYYGADDFNKIAEAATAWKLYHESYFNSLRDYIRSLTTNEDLGDVEYGMEIPEEYQTDVFRQLTGGDEN